MLKDKISSNGVSLVFINDYLIRITAHYTDNFASDIIYFINQVEERLKEERFQKEHTWFLGFYKNGVVFTDVKKVLFEVKIKEYRAIYSYTIELEEKYGFKEPKITIRRLNEEITGEKEQ